MDSAFEVHGGALSAAAAMVRPAKQSLAPPAYWPSAPLPVPDGVTRGASGSSSQLEDALAQHMLLLDLEEPDDGSPPQQLPQQQGGMAARRKLGPVTPNGFTPAEVRPGRIHQKRWDAGDGARAARARARAPSRAAPGFPPACVRGCTRPPALGPSHPHRQRARRARALSPPPPTPHRLHPPHSPQAYVDRQERTVSARRRW